MISPSATTAMPTASASWTRRDFVSPQKIIASWRSIWFVKRKMSGEDRQTFSTSGWWRSGQALGAGFHETAIASSTWPI